MWLKNIDIYIVVVIYRVRNLNSPSTDEQLIPRCVEGNHSIGGDIGLVKNVCGGEQIWNIKPTTTHITQLSQLQVPCLFIYSDCFYLFDIFQELICVQPNTYLLDYKMSRSIFKKKIIIIIIITLHHVTLILTSLTTL